MCTNCINGNKPDALQLIEDMSKLQAENDELKKQVAALTQALETQNRENQPYIKELEAKNTHFKDLLFHAKKIMDRNMEPNPDQHAASDMMHFVYNDLEELFPSQGQPLNAPDSDSRSKKQ